MVDLLDYVFDDAGNPVGATVVAIGRTVGGSHTTTASTVSGQWSFVGLPNDIYDINVTYLGKLMRRKGDIMVQVGGFVDSGGATPVADGSITAAKLASAAVTGPKLAGSAVVTTALADGAVTTAKIGPGAVGTTQLAALSVTSAKLGNAAVGTTQVADGAITSAKLASDISGGGAGSIPPDASITTLKLADQAVTAQKIATNTITANEIGANAVTSSELAAGAVVAGKIAAGGLSATNQVADGIITSAKLAGDVGGIIDFSQTYLTSSVALTGTSQATANTIRDFGSLPAGKYLFFINAQVLISPAGAGALIGLYGVTVIPAPPAFDPELWVGWPAVATTVGLTVSGTWIVNLGVPATISFKGFLNNGPGTATVFGSAAGSTTGFGYVRLG